MSFLLAFLMVAQAADDQTIGVFSLNVSGLEEKAQASAIDALATAVGELEGFSAISRTELDAMLSAEMLKDQLGCDDVACLAEIGAAAGVSRIVGGSISVVEGAILVSLQLTNTRYVNTENRVTMRWKGEQAAINDVLATAVELLVLPGNQRKPGTLVVTGIPDGAAILIDGETRGIAPAPVEGLPVGVHKLQIQAEGFIPHEQPFLVRSGRTTALDIMLTEEPPIYTEWWFWTAAGVVLAGGGTAGWLLTRDSGKTKTVVEEQRTGIDFTATRPLD